MCRFLTTTSLSEIVTGTVLTQRSPLHRTDRHGELMLMEEIRVSRREKAGKALQQAHHWEIQPDHGPEYKRGFPKDRHHSWQLIALNG